MKDLEDRLRASLLDRAAQAPFSSELPTKLRRRAAVARLRTSTLSLAIVAALALSGLALAHLDRLDIGAAGSDASLPSSPLSIPIRTNVPVVHMEAGAGWLWIAGGPLYRVDRTTGAVSTTPINPADESLVSVRAISASSGTVWAAGYLYQPPVAESPHSLPSRAISAGPAHPPEIGPDSNKLWRINPMTNTIASETTLPEAARWVVATSGTIWVGGESSLYRIDPTTARIVQTVTDVGRGLTEATFDGQDLWALDRDSSGSSWKVLRIDAASGTVRARISVSWSERIKAGAGAVWVASSHSVTRIDPAANRVVTVIPTGELAPSGIAVSQGAVWVAAFDSHSDAGDPLLLRIDPATNQIVERRSVPSIPPDDVAVSGPAVWVIHTMGLERLPASPSAGATGSGHPSVRSATPVTVASFVTGVRHEFTPTDVLSPAPEGVTPKLSANQALAELNKSAPISATPIQPDEVFLGYFTHRDGGPTNQLAWAFVFFDQQVPFVSRPAQSTASPRTAYQDALVVIDANTGKHIVTIYGVAR